MTASRHFLGDHRRSSVNTRVHCVALPGTRPTYRDFDRNVATHPSRFAVLNGITPPGIPVAEEGR